MNFRRRHRIAARVLSLVLSATPVAGHHSLALARTRNVAPPAETTAAASPSVHLRIDRARAGAPGELIEKRVRFQAAPRFDTADLVEADAPGGARIVIDVAVWPSDDKRGYEFELGTTVDGAVLADGSARGTCNPCLQEATARAIDAELALRLAAATEALEAQDAAAAGDDVDTAPPATDAAEPVPSPNPATRDAGKRPLGRLGKAGIGVGVGGVVLLGGGIAMLVRGRGQSNGSLESTDGTDTTDPGIALTAIGGGALVAGIILLAVDRRQASRRGRVALVPMGLRGASLAGRF